MNLKITKPQLAQSTQRGQKFVRSSALFALPSWRVLAVCVALAVAVLLVNLVALRLLPTGYGLDIGTRADRALVAGFHGAEQDSAGTSYRWTNGEAALTLRGPATSAPAIVELGLGWLPPGAVAPRRVELHVDGAPWLTLAAPDQLRRYQLLLPPSALADGTAVLALRSETTVVKPDDRPLGVRLDAAGLRWPQTRWPLPSPIVLVAQVGLGLAWLALARQLGVGTLPAVSVAAALIGGLAALGATQLLVAAPWQGRLLGAGLVCATLIGGANALLPRIEPGFGAGWRRALLLLVLAALAIRLVGVLNPTFAAHDLLVNSGRLRNVQLGDLTLFDRPSEFSRNVAVVSPTVFILAVPLTLLGDRALALHTLYTLLDGLTPLLVALLARRFGLGERGSLVAAGLIALLPMHLTALYWGFVKQIVGQWLTLLLLVVAAGPAPRRPIGWIAVGALCAVNLLIHPGGLLLSGVCLGLWLLLGFGQELRQATGNRQQAIARQHSLSLEHSAWNTSQATGVRQGWAALLTGEHTRAWWGWLLTLGGACLLTLVIQYAEAIQLMVGGLLDGSTATLDSTNQVSDETARLMQIWIGLRASFEPLPLLLVLAGLAALLWRARGSQRLLAATWLASALLFLGVDIASGQQVRYGYFVAPLACVGVAALVEPLLKLRAGRLAAGALVALVLVAGLSLWLAAAFYGVKPSVNPLTH